MMYSIGIVGGVGPFAGIALQHAILRHVRARRDQDYPPVVSISAPHQIPDRTAFLLGETDINPAYAIIDQIRLLYSCGARIVGIPCNTAHASQIFSVIQAGSSHVEDLTLVNMLDETFRSLKEREHLKAVGVLATLGSYKSRVFEDYGHVHGCDVRVPSDEQIRNSIHQSIYDEDHGIKVRGTLTDESKEKLDEAFRYFSKLQVDSVILGCTELSVVFKEESYQGFSLIDPVDVLARRMLSIYRQQT